jgi:hypothetical protein
MYENTYIVLSLISETTWQISAKFITGEVPHRKLLESFNFNSYQFHETEIELPQFLNNVSPYKK